MSLNWIEEYWDSIKIILKMFFESGLIFVIGWWLAKFFCNYTKKIMFKAKIDAAMISFVLSILKIFLRGIVIISVIGNLGIPLTPLLTALGAVGVTAGLAIKDSLANVASGMLIVSNKMFNIGDYLEIQNFEGTVKKIEMFFTTLITNDNKKILIPNSIITSNNLINHTACNLRRLDVRYNIDYDSDLEKAKMLLQRIIKRNDNVLLDPISTVDTGEYKENCIDVVAKIWCKTEYYWDLYSYMQKEVKSEFDKNKIQFSSKKIEISLMGGNKNVI